MKLPTKHLEVTTPMTAISRYLPKLVGSLLVLLVALTQIARTQQPTADQSEPLSEEQVVHNLMEMNLHRLHALQAYQGTRTYRVDYHGFPGSRSAEMVVDVKYQSPGTKEFTVRSSTGSKLIIDRVFKKLLAAEQEALNEDAQKRIALNTDNYDFKLVGLEDTPAGLMYVLIVEPRTKDKFLYRGRIWVESKDFAVVRLKAEPAKNPSFWTKKSEIEQEYMKVSDFWLPALNRSVSAIRLGGRAELTIEYDNYQITSANPIANSSTEGSTDTSRLRTGGPR